MSQQNADVFQVYRRGFLGQPIKEINKAPINSTIMKQLKNLQYNQTSFVMDEKNSVFNNDIEVLYSQHTKKSARTNTFDFHELILTAALSAFGTTKFIEWLEIQSKSPNVTYVHSKFLLDTLKFIETGKREMVLENWEPLLNSHALSGEYENIIDDALRLNKNVRIIDLKDVIRFWCGHPGGLTDLLTTLHILFGR